MEARLTVCIPAYNCASFIQRAIDALKKQSFLNWQALISIDESDDNSVEVCQRLTREDKRFVIYRQKQRLGWAQNINFLLEQVDTEYYMIHPHDDFLSENYLHEIVSYLDDNLDCSAAVGLLRYTGVHRADMFRDNYFGTPYQRVSKYLLEERNGLLFRAVVRKPADNKPFLLQEHAFESKGVDLVWIVELLLRGNAACLSSAIYFKHKWPDSVSSIWSRSSPEFRVQSVVAYTRLMKDLIRNTTASISVVERSHLQRQLFLSTLRYFFSSPRYFNRKRYSLDELLSFVSLLFSDVEQPGGQQQPAIYQSDSTIQKTLELALQTELVTLKEAGQVERARLQEEDLAALSMAQESTGAQKGPFFLLFKKSQDEMASGNKSEFLLTLREISSLARANPGILHKLSYEFLRAGALTEAIEVITRACRLEPANKAHWNRAGALFLKLDDLPSSEQAFRKALALDVQSESALYHLGLLAYKQGRNLEAKEFILTAIKLYPDRVRQELLLKRIEASIAEKRRLRSQTTRLVKGLLRRFMRVPGLLRHPLRHSKA